MSKIREAIRDIVSDMHFLFTLARRFDARTPVYTWLTAAIRVALSLAELAALPLILHKVETGASVSTLIVTVCAVTVLLLALHFSSRYADGLFFESREHFRMKGATLLAQKALTASYPFAADSPHVQRLSRAAEAINRGGDAPVVHMWQTLSYLLINVTGLALYAWLLSRLSVLLLTVTAVSAVAVFFVIRYVNGWGRRHQSEEDERHDRLQEVMRRASSEELSKEIRVFGLIPWLKSIYDSAMRALEACVDRRAKVYVLTNLADAVLTLLRNGIAYAVLLQMALTDMLSVSEFVLYFSAIGGLTMWVSGLLSDLSALRGERQQLLVYRAYLEQEELFRFEGGEMPATSALHTVELRNVTFTYPGTDVPILKHIDLTLHAGETLAVVGLNGSGKTTLARLLCGLYDPDEGAVLLDGKDVRQLDRRAYYALFSAVLQEHSLPEVTVAQSVAQQTEAIDVSRMWDCLEKAGIARTVRRLPHGADTPVGQDGAVLSGGELQRLLLARALYKDGDILLLDEPTAALDPIAENALYREYGRMTKGKSAVFISHRLASTRFCDRIVYLADGAIAEEGTHEELLARGGAYAELFAVQSRYYREGRDPDDGTIE